jgi:CubicO group peptidase (beta-lactamase class C family)
MADSDEPYRYVLGQAVASPPGKRWTYSSGDTALLGAVLQKVSGQSLEEFARELLFEPLGITDVEWSAMQPSGETSAGAGLRLRPRDMAKIGQLVLAGGTWEGRQIVSERWTAESTAAHVQRYPGGYGYQWWTDTSHIGDREVAWIAAMGRGGQRIFIVPDYDLVVAITAGLYADNAQDAVALDILDNYVLAAIRE